MSTTRAVDELENLLLPFNRKSVCIDHLAEYSRRDAKCLTFELTNEGDGCSSGKENVQLSSDDES